MFEGIDTHAPCSAKPALGKVVHLGVFLIGLRIKDIAARGVKIEHQYWAIALRNALVQGLYHQTGFRLCE